jgi:hypothetical protein
MTELWWKAMSLIKTGALWTFHLSELALGIFFTWILIALAVDAVSDASVSYVIPGWGMGVSVALMIACWVLGNGIRAMAQSSVFKSELAKQEGGEQ